MFDGAILLTGASGLIGYAVSDRLERQGRSWAGVDLKPPRTGLMLDIRDTARLARCIDRASGIIHLAAVSRVIHGERDPWLCRAVNVDATAAILDTALKAPSRPWVIYASSREVYGEQARQPVSEDATQQPLNTYARSKADAERLVNEARDAGLRTAILRFSNVYGGTNDHDDRVVPAFVKAALAGGIMRVEGDQVFLDLTHVADVADGILCVVDALDDGERRFPPIHLVSGEARSLLELANTADEVVGRRARIVMAPPRSFDVHRFVGDPRRALALLGWRTTISLRTGLADYARVLAQQDEETDRP